MTIEEATNVTIEDAIKTFERLVFSQDFSPSTLRGKAICKIALKALHAQQQSNDPLTREELRKMDGEPVWVQTPGIPQYGRWVIVAGVDTEYGQRTLYCQGDYTCRNYGRDWIAYRRKPEE